MVFIFLIQDFILFTCIRIVRFNYYIMEKNDIDEDKAKITRLST